MYKLKSLYILIFSIENIQAFVLPDDLCGGISCRPGRECRSGDPGGEPECDCIQRCVEHWKPVCGSDGLSYDNHCELHRSACISGTPISPLHEGFCRRDGNDYMIKDELIKKVDLISEPRETNGTLQLPTACFENDRNRLREFMMSWFQLYAKKQMWYSHGMSYQEELWGHFYNMDKNEDNYLDSKEMLDYLEMNKTEGKYKERNEELRQLCLDALVEEGDNNFDWRLSYSEYKKLLSDAFTPSSKVCSLDGEMFEDGKETFVECNGCVCACGKWICTSNKCPEGFRNRRNFLKLNKFELEMNNNVKSNYVSRIVDGKDDKYENNEDEDYNDSDYDDPEDDPDIQGIDWF